MELHKYKLGELLDVRRGTSLAGEFYATEGKYVRLTCGNFDYVNNCFKENTSKDDIFYIGNVREEFVMQKGDIITPLTEQAIGLLGSTAIIPESGKYIQSQDVAKIICKEELLYPMYAFYLISSASVKAQLSAAAQQTKIRHTSPDKIKDCVVWIPDLTTQKEIASVLSNLDKKIVLNKQISSNLEYLIRQLYDYWFVQFDYPESNGKPYKSSGGKMVFSEQLKREIPSGWEVKMVSEIAEVYNGATPSTSDASYYGGDIIWITPKDLSTQQNKFIIQGERNITVEGYNSCSTHLLPMNAILMSSRAPIGLFSIAKRKLCTNQGFKSFVPKDEVLNTYLYYYLMQHKAKIEQLGTGTTFKEVSREDMLKFYVLIPPINILRVFEEKSKCIGNEQLVLQQDITSLIRQREELLPLLMNGQVDIVK